jgi:hypothetical protein
MVSRFGQDDRAVLPRAVAMTVGIFDPDLNDVRVVRRDVALGYGETPVAGAHLDPVVGDAQTNREVKGF